MQLQRRFAVDTLHRHRALCVLKVQRMHFGTVGVDADDFVSLIHARRESTSANNLTLIMVEEVLSLSLIGVSPDFSVCKTIVAYSTTFYLVRVSLFKVCYGRKREGERKRERAAHED